MKNLFSTLLLILLASTGLHGQDFTFYGGLPARPGIPAGTPTYPGDYYYTPMVTSGTGPITFSIVSHTGSMKVTLDSTSSSGAPLSTWRQLRAYYTQWDAGASDTLVVRMTDGLGGTVDKTLILTPVSSKLILSGPVGVPPYTVVCDTLARHSFTQYYHDALGWAAGVLYLKSGDHDFEKTTRRWGPLLMDTQDSVVYSWGKGGEGHIILKNETAIIVRYYQTNGWYSYWRYDTIMANLYPDPKITGPDMICSYDTAVYSTPNHAGKTQSWNVVGGTILGSSTDTLVTVLWSGPVCQVMLTKSNGACAVSDTLEVSLIPSGHLDLLRDTARCKVPSLTVQTHYPYTWTSYLWSTGDSSSSTAVSALGAYAVTVTNSAGCAYTDTAAVTAFAFPLAASFTCDTVICLGSTSTFTSTAAGAATWAWQSDGVPAGTPTSTTSWIFPAPVGDHEVTLVVGAGGCTDTSASQTVHVVSGPPVAAFGVMGSGLTMSYSDSSYGAVSYLWDFGDGATDTIANPVHTYTSLADSTCLVVTGACGGTDTLCRANCPPPTGVGFTFTIDSLGNATFDGVAMGSTSFSWEFGDGGASSLEDPLHTYTAGGAYEVCVTAHAGCGSVTYCDSLYYAPPGFLTSFTLFSSASGGGGSAKSSGASSFSDWSGRLTGTMICDLSDGGLAMCGLDSLGTVLVRLDRFGNTQWTRRLDATAGALAGWGKDVLVAGHQGPAGAEVPILLHLDTEGNVLWARKYSSTPGAKLTEIVTHEGSIWLGGTNGTNAVMLHTDGNGTLLMGKLFSGLAGQVTGIAPIQTGCIFTATPGVCRINMDGTVVWAIRTFLGSHQDIVPDIRTSGTVGTPPFFLVTGSYAAGSSLAEGVVEIDMAGNFAGLDRKALSAGTNTDMCAIAPTLFPGSFCFAGQSDVHGQFLGVSHLGSSWNQSYTVRSKTIFIGDTLHDLISVGYDKFAASGIRSWGDGSQKMIVRRVNRQRSMMYSFFNSVLDEGCDTLRTMLFGTGPDQRLVLTVSAAPFGTESPIMLASTPASSHLRAACWETCEAGHLNATWDTTALGTTAIDITATMPGEWNGVVAWGDGSTSTFTTSPARVTHAYAACGNYQVTVGTVNSCGTLDKTLQVVASPHAEFNPNSDTICSNGAILVHDLSVGSSVFAGAWSLNGVSFTPTTNPFWVNGTPGTTTLRRIAQMGTCRDTLVRTFAMRPAPEAHLMCEDTAYCRGEEIRLFTSQRYVKYSWTPIPSVPYDTLTTVLSGTTLPWRHSVSVVDTNGCFDTDTITSGVDFILHSPAVSITPSSSITFCHGDSVLLTATAGFSSYQWSTGATTPSTFIHSSGAVQVTATDGHGCKATKTAFATKHAPVVSISGTSTACTATTLTAVGSSLTGRIWSTGSTSPSISAPTSGTYSVTATNSTTGCTGTASVPVTISSPLTASILTSSGGTEICSSSLVLSVGPGTFGSYLWSVGVSSPTIYGSSAGTYTVTVTSGGCSAVRSITLTSGSFPITIASSPGSLCPGDTVTLSGPSSMAAYRWSTGAITPSIQVTSAGTYYLTVTHASGCTSIGSLVLNEAVPAPSTSSILSTPSSPASFQMCEDDSLTLSTINGYSYLWSTGATTRSIQVGDPGMYSVTVSDPGSGCSVVYSRDVIEHPDPIPTITASSASLCGVGSVSLSADVGFATYLWSTGATSRTIPVTTPGTYSVTVTNYFGCQGTAIHTVGGLTGGILPTGPLSVCPGESLSLTAGGGYSSYLWSTGATSSSITVTSPGPYAVTVTDSAGCTGVFNAVVNTSSAATPAISPGGSPSFCAGGSVLLDASAGYASYLWSNGSTSATVAAATPGTYAVTVTSIGGCVGSASVTVTELPAPTPTITSGGSLVICPGDTASLFAGTGYSSYLWSTGETTAGIPATAGGTYSVTVTNASGCTGSDVETVTLNPTPSLTLAPSGPTTFCAGGSVLLDAGSGHTAYLWSTGATTSSITASTSGIYSVTVSNGVGCTSSAMQTVTVNPLPTPGISASGATTFCDGGSVILDAGSGYASYLWSTGATSPSIVASATGSYTVTVTSSAGCEGMASQSVTVNPSPSLTLTTSGPTTFCAGGSVLLDAGSGHSAYLWSTGATTSSITASTSGIYSVTVSNTFGCEASTTETITVNPAPTPSISASSTLFCPGETVTLNAGGGYASYLWSTGSTGSTLTTGLAGTVNVTVTNSFGCEGVDDITLSHYPSILADLGPDTVLCPGASMLLDPGAGGFLYNWSTGASTPTITITSAGMYGVTVTSSAGCSATDMVILSPGILATSLFSFTGGSPTFDFNDLSTGSPTTWLWDFGDGATSALPSPSHTYPTLVDSAYTVCLTVTNDCGPDTHCETLLVTSTMASVLQDVRIYPVPTSEDLFVELPSSLHLVQVMVLDALGRTCLQQAETRNSFSLPVSQLADGVYLLVLRTREGDLHRKVEVVK